MVIFLIICLALDMAVVLFLFCSVFAIETFDIRDYLQNSFRTNIFALESNSPIFLPKLCKSLQTFKSKLLTKSNLNFSHLQKKHGNKFAH